MMSYELVSLGLLSRKEIEDEKSVQPAYRKYFMHGVSHHLGLDVHDSSDRETPFKEGMVLTCEPGIYIKEEKLGIRLEDDILITSDGPVNLTSHIPIQIEELVDLINA